MEKRASAHAPFHILLFLGFVAVSSAVGIACDMALLNLSHTFTLWQFGLASLAIHTTACVASSTVFVWCWFLEMQVK